MNILITGVAGFIGSQVALHLLNKNFNVIGVDNLNDYYSVSLKKDRLESIHNLLQSFDNYTRLKPEFEFVELDIVDKQAVDLLFSNREID